MYAAAQAQNHWLAESGSTKSVWLCFAGPAEGTRFTTEGFNPSYLPHHTLPEALAQIAAPHRQALAGAASMVWYGAGCAGQAPRRAMEAAVAALLPGAGITIEHDLLAAAHALHGNAPGLVAILGTGSHAACYDGQTLSAEAVNLGYVLGDEGSGADMGKRLLQGYFYRRLPAQELAYLDQALGLVRDEAIDRIYRQPWPNRWMASLAPVVAGRPALRACIAGPALAAFAQTHLEPLAQRSGIDKVGAVGSIAAHFAPELEAALQPLGLALQRTLADPVEALAAFHKRQLAKGRA